MLDASYTHSLVGALLISAAAYFVGNRYWKEARGGVILAGLSFSHWIVDLFVHHQDMPILPGNLGDLPMLGLGLWDYEYAVFGIEVALAVIGGALYFRWAATERPSRRWYVGPVIIAGLFAAQILADIPRLP